MSPTTVGDIMVWGDIMRPVSSAEILCVGTELLLGDIVNTNASFISRRLAALGVPVYRQAVVGDNPERLRDAVAESFGRTDCLILTGGLGPTCDDITKEVTAEYLGLELELNEEALRRMQSYFSSTGRTMTENNRKQAYAPHGARVLQNNWGTAPGLIIEQGEKTAILLPGPPIELEPMWCESVEPYLMERSSAVIVSKNLYILGMGESAVEAVLHDMMTSNLNPTVAPYAGNGECRVRVSARAADEVTAAAMCDEQIEKIKKTEVGKFIYGIDIESIENALVSRLRREGRSVAVAESCTGGLIAKRITDIAGSSEVFPGGCVTYSAEAKEKMLGVSHGTIERFGVVSAETACEMARGVRLAFGTDIGIATTGIAGPGGGTTEQPVGTVYIAVSTAKTEEAKLLQLSPWRSREFIRICAATNAMNLALKS
ncbi:MAG: competence/damage-inducible protein A [Eubacteriales bacterium]